MGKQELIKILTENLEYTQTLIEEAKSCTVNVEKLRDLDRLTVIQCRLMSQIVALK